jgi:hypothetical protein
VGDWLHCVEGGEEDVVEAVVVLLPLADLVGEASDERIAVVGEGR